MLLVVQGFPYEASVGLLCLGTSLLKMQILSLIKVKIKEKGGAGVTKCLWKELIGELLSPRATSPRTFELQTH
jgi:hypothetical protein